MIDEIYKPVLLFAMLFSVIISFAFWGIYYRKYYSYMKIKHHNEWLKLMNKDPLIEAGGAWIRWPAGSIYLLLSVFSKEKSGDDKLAAYKARAQMTFVIFGVAFILLLIVAMALPKYP